MKLRRAYRRAKIPMLAASVALVLYVVLIHLSPWPPMVTLKHIVSSRNCDAAREMGLAPAYRGGPAIGRATIGTVMALPAKRGRRIAGSATPPSVPAAAPSGNPVELLDPFQRATSAEWRRSAGRPADAGLSST